MTSPDTSPYDELESMTESTITPSEFVGDELHEYANNITRIYIQNLNGISWNSEGGRWPYICDAMQTIQADIACFSELNIDTTRYDVRTKMESITRQHFAHNCLTLASSKRKSTTTYKPGGTAILACNSIATSIQTQTRDRMGRWTSISIPINDSKRLRIISAYQVCHQSNPGANTAHAHQAAQLIIESAGAGETARSTPRQAFIRDLTHFVKQAQREGDAIILAGDFNDDISSPNSGMHQLAATCNLVDLFSHRLGTSNHPPTYQRGTKRIDYILISPTILPAIQAAGYDPFGYRIPSDHRGMFLDLQTDTIFGQPLQEMAPIAKRDFSTSTPGVVQSYVTAKMTYLVQHSFFDRLARLDELRLPAHEFAEQLDRDYQRASMHAAKVCTKKPQPPWSPKLAEAWAEIHYYRLLESAAKTQVNYTPAIHKLQNRWPHLPLHLNQDIESIQLGRRQAISKLKQIREEAQRMRDEYLHQRYAHHIENDDAQSAKIVQRIIRAENQRRVHAKIKNLRFQNNESSSLSSIKIPKDVPLHDTEMIKTLPDNPDHWETVTVPADIEQILIKRNQHHFSQADDTPFAQPPLTASVGYKADGCAADLILTGDFRSPDVTPATDLLIRHLQKRTATTLEGTITKADVLGKLKSWHESTTTSPSGLHLGHYHSLWRDPKMNPSDPARDTVLKHQSILLEALISLLNYALRFGYTYERWTKIVNIMLHKDPGNPRIHRLRIIHIYEADYNLLLAVKWRQVLHHAEDQQLLNPGLYGSRPGRTAHDPAIIETLQHETYRMSMKTGINFDLDATSCYDRILPNVAMLSSQRMGLSPKVARLNARTLEQARYHLKTKLGTSESFYSHSNDTPIYGTGQGSGNSPTIWCLLCSALFDAFSSTAHGATFSDYYHRTRLPMSMVGFVDDCTQRVNSFHATPQPTPPQLLQLMQHDTQLWNDLLWASGGALEQSKCSYHLIQSDWTTNGQPFLKGGTSNIPLIITHQTRRTTIRQKSNYESHKSLGCHISPAYTRAQPWNAISRKNDKFAEILEMNFFTRTEAWTFYTSVYLPSITYPLPITPLTRGQCQSLDSRFLRSLLPRCGYNRNMARAIRYAPTHVGGAGFKSIYILQGTLLLQQIQKLFNSPSDPLGKMLLITASWTQAFLGTSKFFLTDVESPIPPAGPSLLLDLRQFLQDINGTLVVQNAPVPQMLRKHDRCIMDIVLQQTKWTQTHQIQINACRRYCQAQTLSDITNPLGTRLLPWVYHPHHDNSRPSTLRISAFNQQLPGAAAWKTWRRFLATISNSLGVLYTPLQEWITDVSDTRHWPPTLYDPHSDMLMSHYRGSTYQVHHRLWPGCYSIRPTNNTVPAKGYPTTTTIIMDTLRPLHNYIQQDRSNATTIYIGTTRRYKSTTHPWETALLQDCHYLVNDDDLLQVILQGTLITCSDGSATQSAGTFGFVVSSGTGRRLVRGKGQAHGSYPNSFRSEAYGVLATMRWIHHATQACALPDGYTLRITHYLDNKSVIRRIEKNTHHKWTVPNQRLLPEQDVIDEIVATLKQIPAKVEFQWVRGHQDTSKPYHSLPLPAQLNCDADQAASLATVDMKAAHHIPPLPHTPSQLIINHHTITSQLKQRVYALATTPLLYEHMSNRFGWTDTTMTVIDWELYPHIIKKYQTNWNTIVKHLHGISPTGKIAHRNDSHLPHECPTCSHPHETNNHVLLCPHPHRAKWRAETTEKIHKYQDTFVDPRLLDILRDGLTRFHHSLPEIPTNTYPEKYHNLIAHQNSIGWDHLYRGKWCIEWRDCQDIYHKSHRAQQPSIDGTTWMIGLGRLFIDQWLLVWKRRNQDRHGADELQQTQLRQHRIHSELRELYQYREEVCPRDRSLFHASLAHHIHTHPNLDTQESWILTNREAILASVTAAQQLGITRNHTINEYPTFNPIIPVPIHADLTVGMQGV